tara:strand:- start:300 stop:1508 length:1209 start_codon:yes stop_codon:yes gene_type:complete
MVAENKLSNAFLKSAKTGKTSDGGGLWFWKRVDGGAQFFLRFSRNGQREEMGIGGWPAVSLQEARLFKTKYKALARQGIDPRRARDSEIKQNSNTNYTLKQYVEKIYEETVKYELKNDGVNGRWLSPLRTHVFPKIGHINIEQLNADDVIKCLRPIWHEKPDPAIKALGRISRTIDIANADDSLDVDLGLIKKVKTRLGKQFINTDNHISSMPYSNIPDFYQTLLEAPTQTTLAMRLLILTAPRVGPLRQMELSEIEGNFWTIPKEKMKAKKGKARAFTIPLSQEALHVIELAKPFARDGFLFPGTRKNSVMSDNTMRLFMKRAGSSDTPGGFRASIRTWLDEVVNARFEISEEIMSHKIGTKVTRAYRRTELVEQRALIMERWANFVTGAETKNIIEHRHG